MTPFTPRIPSGIPGLDSLIENGFMTNSMTLVAGSTGTGKTIFCLQFLIEGLKKNEPGIYLTLEEPPEDIRADALQFGWDLEKYEKSGLLKIIYQDPFETDITPVIVDTAEFKKAKRIVVDSISILGLYMKDPTTIRKQLGKLMKSIKSLGCVTLVISEIEEERAEKALSRFGVEEFVVDGVIILKYLGLGNMECRNLVIRKMRRTNHGKDSYPFDIKKNGIEVKKVD